MRLSMIHGWRIMQIEGYYPPTSKISMDKTLRDQRFLFVLYYTKKAESDDWQCFIIRSNISKLKKCLSLRKSSSFACTLRAAFYSRASETRACVKITPREKRRHAAGKEKNEWFLRALQMGAFTNGYCIDLARAKTNKIK